MCGAIPSIFPFLSDKQDPTLYFERVRALVHISEVTAIIASAQFIEPLRAVLPDVQMITEADLAPGQPRADFSYDAREDDIAFLQHSSGTTGLQKGIALSHRSVLNQIASYGAAIGLQATDRVVSWLPLYHDMGLIAGFIMPVAQAIPLVIMSPFHWVRDPLLLLQVISQYSGTLCWLPNFAYNFMAQRVREDALAGINLGTVRAFINCSEPVYAQSHRQFMARFSPCGLRPGTLATCYAMAENTFAVTQSRIGEATPVDRIDRSALRDQNLAIPAQGEKSVEMLSCGKAIAGCQLRIVDEAFNNLPERTIGEIAIQSDSMLSGYYHREDLTAQALIDGWYRTGDLGYLDGNGELYITGRKKDLIIVGGKNVYPQDLEAIANEVAGVHPGRVAAFGVPDERLATETVVIVCEVDTTNDREIRTIDREIRRRVAQQTEVTIGRVEVVEAGWLIKSSSGKIARGANREKYLIRRSGG
jgi:acyl-CoA synthetase (AMP-forming)/AMP-acid ligase II